MNTGWPAGEEHSGASHRPCPTPKSHPLLPPVTCWTETVTRAPNAVGWEGSSYRVLGRRENRGVLVSSALSVSTAAFQQIGILCQTHLTPRNARLPSVATNDTLSNQTSMQPCHRRHDKSKTRLLVLTSLGLGLCFPLLGQDPLGVEFRNEGGTFPRRPKCGRRLLRPSPH